MARISSYPKTAKVDPNTFFVTDNPASGTKAMEAEYVALALLQFTSGGYKIAVVDTLPPENQRDEMTLYFVRKESS